MTNQLVQTVRGWPGYHRRIVFTIALIWLALTLRALLAEPEYCTFFCIGDHKTFLPGFAFAYLVIFVLGSQLLFRKRWAVAARPSLLAYGGLMILAGPLALLPGSSLGKLVQGPVFAIQDWLWNAKL